MKKLLVCALALAMVLSMSASALAFEPVPKEEIKVGFVYIGDISDGGYTMAHHNGTLAMQEALGLSDDQIIIKRNVPENSDCEIALMELVEQGCDIIFGISFGYMEYMADLAEQYPDVIFSHCSGYMSNDTNFNNYFGRIYEARYLTGIAAGLRTENNHLGYVAAMQTPECIYSMNAYFLGARSVNPDVTMDVTFTGSWYDEAAEKEAANKLIANDCKLISQHADSMGAPTACETKGIPNVSYNGSTLAACPKTFIVSSRIDWTPYMTYMIECVANGKAIDVDWCGGITEGSVVLTDINEAVAAKGTAEAIKAAEEEMKAGTLHVFDTAKDNYITVKGEKLSSYMADVDTDADYTADTEAVSDGYFHESEYRSAPYFNVQIDGITLLNSKF